MSSARWLNFRRTVAPLPIPSKPATRDIIQGWLLSKNGGTCTPIKDVVERFASQGFITIAPDLYHGQAASEPTSPQVSYGVGRVRAVAEIQAAISHLQSLEEVWPKKSA